ncbi:hypothetical protein [Longitalea arenae]|uniref:hypothetical protein n=1 Tax=Longitalea arenae TaxID=2812558 RepID=UPI0019678186|nr:hypothetical protein [Longitalea arenae]
MKLFLRFLLLCISLWTGYAQAAPVQTGCFPKDIINKAQAANDLSLHNHRLWQGQAPFSASHNAHDAIADSEVDDDDDDNESRPGKKNLPNDRCSFIQSPAFTGLYHYNKRLPFCDHFSGAAACKFIFHCVIRI